MDEESSRQNHKGDIVDEKAWRAHHGEEPMNGGCEEKTLRRRSRATQSVEEPWGKAWKGKATRLPLDSTL